MNVRAALSLDKYVTGPVVRPRVEDFPRQLFIVGDSVVRNSLAKHQVALAAEELPDRGLVLDVEPVDPQLDAKLLGEEIAPARRQALDARPSRRNTADWRGPC